MKILLVTFSTLIVMLGHSQVNFNLTGTTTNVSGTVQHIELTESVSGHEMHYFDVINSSGGDLDLILTRKILSETSGWSNFLCYGPAPFGICYPANPDIVWSTISETIVDTAKISTYITAPTSGSAHYRYYLSEDGMSYVDSVDIMVNSTADINSIDFEQLHIFPNPANDIVNIKNNAPFTYTLMNAVGTIILTSENESTQSKLTISGLSNGIYFLLLRTNEAELIKRIQVK